jgi:hypothetical protein
VHAGNSKALTIPSYLGSVQTFLMIDFVEEGLLRTNVLSGRFSITRVHPPALEYHIASGMTVSWLAPDAPVEAFAPV